MKIPEKEIQKIEESTIVRYNRRYEQFGIDPKTLGWGSQNDQVARFGAAVRNVDFSKKHVLDIGCGFSDFYDFLEQNYISVAGYTGIDINETLVNVSKGRFPGNSYDVRNILYGTEGIRICDIVVMFGLLNLRFDTIDNLEYSRQMISAAFQLAKEALVVDFISTHRTPAYPEEDFIYYHDPRDVLNIGFSLSDNLLLVHDYAPIPQKEFILILKKWVS